MNRKLFAVVSLAVMIMSALPMAVSADNTIGYVHGNDQQAWWRVSDMVYAPFFEITNDLHWTGAWQFPNRWIEYDGFQYDAGSWPEYVLILSHVYYLNGSNNASTEVEYALTGNIGMLQTRAYEALVIINDQAVNPMSHAELMALAHAMYTPEYVHRMSRLARAATNGCTFVAP